MLSRLLLGIVALSLACLASMPASKAKAQTLTVQINMYGDAQVPPVETTTWGFVRFLFDDDRSAAIYIVDVKGIPGGAIIGADIHRGAPGENGPVVFHLTDGNFIVTSGEMTFSAQDLAEMEAGSWYVSLKTFDFPNGELRGQIVLPANFRGDSVVNPPSAAGAATISPPNTGGASLKP